MFIEVKKYTQECRKWKEEENEIKELDAAGLLSDRICYALVLTLVKAVGEEMKASATSDYTRYGKATLAS